MSIFDDDRDVFLPDFKWVFEEEDLIEGKKKMNAEDFLNGFQNKEVLIGQILG